MGTFEETGLFRKFISKLTRNERIEFLKNLAHDEEINFNRYCHRTNAIDYIILAFDWAGSESGFDYWSKISDKWRNNLNDFKNGVKLDYPRSGCSSIW